MRPIRITILADCKLFRFDIDKDGMWDTTEIAARAVSAFTEARKRAPAINIALDM